MIVERVRLESSGGGANFTEYKDVDINIYGYSGRKKASIEGITWDTDDGLANEFEIGRTIWSAGMIEVTGTFTIPPVKPRLSTEVIASPASTSSRRRWRMQIEAFKGRASGDEDVDINCKFLLPPITFFSDSVGEFILSELGLPVATRFEQRCVEGIDFPDGDG